MKYKILPGTALFEALAALETQRRAAIDLIRGVIVDQMGYNDFAFSNDYIAGCHAIYINDPEKLEGWKKIGEDSAGVTLYWPKARQVELLDRLNSLPSISWQAVNDIVGFSFQVTSDLSVYSRPGWIQSADYALIAIGEGCQYQQKDDMILIDDDDYDLLAKQAQEHNANQD